MPPPKSDWDQQMMQLETEIRRVPQELRERCRVPGDLFRHTADVHAGSAEPSGLDEYGPRPVLGGSTRRGETAATPADHDEVELSHPAREHTARHRGGPAPGNLP